MPVEIGDMYFDHNNVDGGQPVDYASVTRTVKDGHLYIETNDNHDTSAIQKITEKYDTLGKLRSSLEKLDLNEDDPIINDDHHNNTNNHDVNDDHHLIQNGNNENDDYYYQQKNADDHQEEEDEDSSEESELQYKNQELSDQDLLQVEIFFRSQKTSVYVCPTLADLYLSTIEISTLSPANKQHPSSRTQTNWQLRHTGIPVLLLDSGESRSRTKRRIQIVLAEKGTGFLLWRDTIDNLTNYKAIDNHFHTMFMSSDHRKMVGLSFSNVSAAREFYDKVETLTSDPANISLSGPNSKAAKKTAAKKKKKGDKKIKLPTKMDISQPCCFQHVTKVDLGDKDHFVTLATLTGLQTPQKDQNDDDGNHQQPTTELQKYKSEPTLRIRKFN